MGKKENTEERGVNLFFPWSFAGTVREETVPLCSFFTLAGWNMKAMDSSLPANITRRI
jgi:hypothetical protein